LDELTEQIAMINRFVPPYDPTSGTTALYPFSVSRKLNSGDVAVLDTEDVSRTADILDTSIDVAIALDREYGRARAESYMSQSLAVIRRLENPYVEAAYRLWWVRGLLRLSHKTHAQTEWTSAENHLATWAEEYLAAPRKPIQSYSFMTGVLATILHRAVDDVAAWSREGGEIEALELRRNVGATGQFAMKVGQSDPEVYRAFGRNVFSSRPTAKEAQKIVDAFEIMNSSTVVTKKESSVWFRPRLRCQFQSFLVQAHAVLGHSDHARRRFADAASCLHAAITLHLEKSETQQAVELCNDFARTAFDAILAVEDDPQSAALVYERMLPLFHLPLRPAEEAGRKGDLNPLRLSAAWCSLMCPSADRAMKERARELIDNTATGGGRQFKLVKGLQCYQDGKWPEAITLLQDATLLNYGSAGEPWGYRRAAFARLLLAQSRLCAGDTAQAVQLLKEADDYISAFVDKDQEVARMRRECHKLVASRTGMTTP
jgi:hypothetical protein